jgi:DNA polymerase elongation subunit (family B)
LTRLPATSRRVLDFDLETVAAGFADPDWVPQTITAWAYCWIGGNHVEVATLKVADREDIDARRQFLEPLLDVIRQADVVTGHNILRFDLPVLNADLMRVGLEPLNPVLAQDTMRLPKSKGFKKGQDVLSGLLGVQSEKLPLNWWEWQRAYADPDHALIRERVVGDVIQHMQLREAMRERGWLTAPRMWKP